MCIRGQEQFGLGLRRHRGDFGLGRWPNSCKRVAEGHAVRRCVVFSLPLNDPEQVEYSFTAETKGARVYLVLDDAAFDELEV